MPLPKSLLTLALAVGFALPLSAGAEPAQNPILKAAVGPAFTISLRTADAAPVRQLEPGTYQIDVDDRSTEHNFHLSGPGIDEATDVEFVGRVTWTVTFADGVYSYECDPHADLMRGSFRVGPPPPPRPPPPKPPRLAAAVGPGAQIALRSASGARVGSLKAGRYVVAVNDRTAADNFHLSGKGVNRRTGVAFRGKTTWSVRFAKGRYTYRSDAHPARRGVFTAR